ncbi:MepB family protein [Plebeiibacterium sediminum]|uniref:MepB family protein n=1 Tax=Plebeiibacterium sediminum TaxID=2992112 RepID=A0AAE3SGA1_9BACT|nr:MepB family protein [Plebeiobacterium sediminum]MCW3787083.1 MepB family protein [Plebeiobacterium sediminum]
MNHHLKYIKTAIYDQCGFQMENLEQELESAEYGACRFKLSGRNIICRNAKITPKKAGQFVTFWKRQENGPIEPYCENDPFNFYVVNVKTNTEFGQFVFPKALLIQKGILSTTKKEGKRAFRVYPQWDITKSKQAQKTQQWQLKYFYEVTTSTDFIKVRDLYELT